MPHHYQSMSCKTEVPARTAFQKVLTKVKEGMHDPLESIYPMRPSSVILSGVESGDQLAHTDTSTTPHVFHLSNRSKSDCRLSTFVAHSPKYRPNNPAGRALGEAEVERLVEVLLSQRDILIVASSTATTVPTPSQPRHARGLVHPVEPQQETCKCGAQRHPPQSLADPLLMIFLRTLDHRDLPTYVHLLLREARWGGGPSGAGRGKPA